MHIWLIKRGPRPEHHNAPFHPVIVCGKKRIAKWEAGATDSKAWVWQWDCDGSGFLLCRWNGFDVDYGHIVREVGPLPDGTHTGFFHDRDKEPWTLLSGAVWWDDKKLPPCLEKVGLIYPTDDFTQQRILDHIADDGASGFGREIPSYWPNNPDHPRPASGAVGSAD
jgi:hypothetical protein